MRVWWEEFIANGSPSRLLRQAAAEFDLLTARRQPARFVIVFFDTEGSYSMSDITVADDETTLRSTIAPVDSEGVPVTLDTPPTYSSSDESVATVTASEDGLTATYGIGTIGDAVITVDTGVDDGQGGTIQGKGTIHVTPGGVAALDLAFQVGPEA